MRHLIFILLLTIFSASALGAGVRYVNDDFEVTVRTGKSNENKILKLLPVGAKVDVLEEEEGEGEYALVRTAEGIEGWVLKRYLSDSPGAKERLAAAQQKITQLNDTIKELKSQLGSTKGEKSELESNELNLSKTNAKLEKELEKLRKVAADPLAQSNENEELKKELLNLKRSIQNYEQENITLRDRSARDWFLIGGGVCVGAIVLGMILPNLRFKRRNSWGSL